MKTPVIALFAAALLLPGCSEKKAEQRGPEAVPVLAARAEAQDVPIVLTAIGTVEPYQSVVVKTLVSGELTKVGFVEGQEVRKGDLLFTIDPRPLEAALAQAQATLARDRAQLENARVEQKRNQELVSKEYITREQYDRSVTSTATLEATVRADEALVENARLQVSYCTIRSPIDGRIGKLAVNQGNIVKLNDTSLVTINQVRPIKVSFTLPEMRLPEVRQRDREGTLEVDASPQADPNMTEAGKLVFIDNAVDRATGTIMLRADFPNTDGALWPGQFVTVKLHLSTRPHAVTIPSPAIQTGQQGTYVFVIKPDRTVEMRPVTPGPVAGDVTIVEKGIAGGEDVVTDGQLRLVPGAHVEIKTGNGAGRPAGAQNQPVPDTGQGEKK